jgi:hypothetical protein
MRRMAKLPLSEKLRWLEEAHEIVRNLERDRAGGVRDERDGSAE